MVKRLILCAPNLMMSVLSAAKGFFADLAIPPTTWLLFYDFNSECCKVSVYLLTTAIYFLERLRPSFHYNGCQLTLCQRCLHLNTA
jgi:hypothetical protein